MIPQAKRPGAVAQRQAGAHRGAGETPAVTTQSQSANQSDALTAIANKTDLSRASLTALKIYSNEYTRGAIVKLAEDHSHPAVAKFIVEKKHGMYQLLDANGPKPYRLAKFTTSAQATGQAIRECERIRDNLTGGGCVRSES